MSDFTNVSESAGTFASITDDTGVDFVEIGDLGSITIEGVGFGEGGFGEGPFGGSQTVIVSASPTAWTNIDEP